MTHPNNAARRSQHPFIQLESLFATKSTYAPTRVATSRGKMSIKLAKEFDRSKIIVKSRPRPSLTSEASQAGS